MPQYQGVWTLQQQAQAQSNQQWVTDPNFKNTTLLLQADGTGSGSQNQTFLDGSTNNFFITRNGNTTQGSFSPFSQAPGYWGVYNTIGSYCQLNNADYAIGTGDFTIEFWMYCVDDTSYGSSAFAGLPGGGVLTVSMSSGSSNARQPYLEFGGVSTAFGTLRDYLNKWTHIAYVRSSGSVVVYQNGIATASPISRTQSFPNCANLYLARLPTDTNQDFRGYLSNFRITKSAVYTSNFTPSTLPLTTTSQGATSCQLLTFQNNRFIDNSSNASTVTPTNTAIQTFSPFAPALQWTSTTVGGSGYFDGTGDYLSSTQSAYAPSGDFTVEAWFYVTTAGGYSGICTTAPSAGTPTGWRITLSPSPDRIGCYFNGSDFTSTNYYPNQWYHVALVRSGSGSNNCSFYVNGVRVSQLTNTTAVTQTSMVIGRYHTDIDNYYLNGYIASLRYTTSAIYSGATITVPTAPVTAVTNTQLLLNYTNAGIYDGKMASVVETVASAQVVTNPVKYGSGSMYFSGVSPYSYLRGNSNLAQSVALAGDFTVECWVWITTTASDGVIIDTRPGSNAGNYWLFYLWTNSGSTKPVVAWYTPAVGYIVNSGGTVPANAWTHIAVSRANGMMRSFINGVIQQTAANTTAYANPGAPYPYIGSSYSVTTDSFKGYIDDLRITNGVARYIANFTPPQQALPRQ